MTIVDQDGPVPVDFPYKRRLKHGRLEPDESERVARLGRLLLRAVEVFEDLEKARRWLHKPQVALEDETPL